MASSFLRRWLFRPSVWTGLIAMVAYCDKTALHGAFVYDDAGSVRKNVVVLGQVPFSDVFTRDFWGTPMSEPASHKSFRPITTMTFRWNWILSDYLGTTETDDHRTLGFHIVNVLLHGWVTGLVTELAAYVFDGGTEGDFIAQLLTGLVFGLHPVHAESVSNITSRGELLMSLFFLLAFLSFASHLPKEGDAASTTTSRWQSILCIYIFPWLCMTLSLFCKEQGATTLITLVVYDFLQNHDSVVAYFQRLRQGNAAAIAFLRRTILLAIETIMVVAWRMYLNGTTIPDFVHDQNPAGFAEDRFTRIYSVNWVYCLYIKDAVYPNKLCCDWSGLSIPLIESWSDPRILGVWALWAVAAGCLSSLIVGLSSHAKPWLKEARQIGLMAFFAFSFSPFLLSSNLLITVGLMKADRVIYLPLLGFCILEALIFKLFFCEIKLSTDNKKTVKKTTARNRVEASRRYSLGHALVLLQLMLFCAKVHERNIAWSHQFTLWESAYVVNPVSYHTIYNFGYEMSIKKRYEEAEEILRPIADPEIEGPSNTFVYTMVLYNLGRCEESNRYLDKAFRVLEEKKGRDDKRYSPRNIARVESNLLMSRAYCKPTLLEVGQYMYKAVEADPSNEMAIDQAMVAAKQLEMAKMMQEQQMRRHMGLQ